VKVPCECFRSRVVESQFAALLVDLEQVHKRRRTGLQSAPTIVSKPQRYGNGSEEGKGGKVDARCTETKTIGSGDSIDHDMYAGWKVIAAGLFAEITATGEVVVGSEEQVTAATKTYRKHSPMAPERCG
jgi:hypothetical protein